MLELSRGFQWELYLDVQLEQSLEFGIEKRISVGRAIARCAIGAILVFQMLEVNDDLLSSFTHHLYFSNLPV
jgi:hypothetical protein